MLELHFACPFPLLDESRELCLAPGRWTCDNVQYPECEEFLPSHAQHAQQRVIGVDQTRPLVGDENRIARSLK